MSWKIRNNKVSGTRIIGYVTLVCVLLVIIDYSVSYRHRRHKIITPNELTQITGTLQNELKIEVADQGSPWVTIKLNEFPEFNFKIDEIQFSALEAKDFVTETKVRDTIFLDILTYDYETKIERIKPLRVSERIINYPFILSYGLRSNSKSYMTLDGVNAARLNDDFLGGWVLVPIAVILILFSVLRLTGIVDKFKNWFVRLQDSR